MDIKCKKCGRFLGSTEHSLQVMLKCPNCRAYLAYHVTMLSENHYQYHDMIGHRA